MRPAHLRLQGRKTRAHTIMLLTTLVVIVPVMLWVCGRFLKTDADLEVPKPYLDEPAARARFDAMMTALHEAQTLSYKGELQWKHGRFLYNVQLMKPNFFRLQVLDPNGIETGAMVGDGNDMWIVWQNTRPFFAVEELASYERTRTKAYMRLKAAPRKHSIKADAPRLVHGMGFPVVDPSLFHWCWDTLLNHIDAIREIGKKNIDGTRCTGIELRFMDGQRSWYLWVSDQDAIPRRLKEVVRAGSRTIVTSERYFAVTINKEVDQSLFRWQPSADWTQVVLPEREEPPLAIGQIAPEIKSHTIDGNSIELSAYRGHVVWLVLWRVGCPPCRAEMPVLEALQHKYTHRGLVVLGVNFIDDEKIARDFLKQHGITFPNVVDSSPKVAEIMLRDYDAGTTPTNVIIDADGRVVDRWYGYDEHDTHGMQIVQQLLGNGDGVE